MIRFLLSLQVTKNLRNLRLLNLLVLNPPELELKDLPPHLEYAFLEASLEEDAEVGLTGIEVDMELGIGDRDE
ncbi:hypothetical protein Tco_0851300, partial [Tanacetum coccineum]